MHSSIKKHHYSFQTWVQDLSAVGIADRRRRQQSRVRKGILCATFILKQIERPPQHHLSISIPRRPIVQEAGFLICHGQPKVVNFKFPLHGGEMITVGAFLNAS